MFGINTRSNIVKRGPFAPSGALLLFLVTPALGITPSPAEMAETRRWASAKFEGMAADAPFSFTYDGKPSSQFLASWKLERSSPAPSPVHRQHFLNWTDPATGLVVRCHGTEWLDSPTLEWTIYFKNTGTADTSIIEDIRALDTKFGGSPQADPLLHYHTGDMCTADSYAPHAEPMPARFHKQIANTGGRPTQNAFPYFNVSWPGEGVIAVLGWPGQWRMDFAREGLGVRLRGGQELTHFGLHAGEEVRGPRVVVQFYKGDWIRGQNLWRRWMVAHNMPHPDGEPVKPMASLCTGNYYPGLMSNAAQELTFLRAHLDAGLRFDGWWQDAGWYPCDGVTWPKTGTWEVDAKRFPKGLREVSDFVHSKGIKSILWFEPERIHAETWLADNHPEWIHGGKKGGLLKLGEPACRQWLTDHIDKLITDQGIDVYRQDFNIDPLPFWRAADTRDRQGITEIRHVEGYLAYWDELLRRHPGMLIDSCASGGRRNDIETMRRAVPLLRSDWYNAPDGQQCHTYGLSLWLPYQGTGAMYGHDKYWYRSSMVAEFTFGPGAEGMANADLPLMKELLDEFRRISDCFFGDFYPLTPYSLGGDVWMAWQYDRPEAGRGVVQIFRRGESIYESARLPLRGLDTHASYRITDLDTGKSEPASGRDLTTTGLSVSIASKPGSAILLYERQPRSGERR